MRRGTRVHDVVVDQYEARLDGHQWLQINETRTAGGGYVSVGTDITALKESEQRLSERGAELGSTVEDLRRSRRALEQQAQQLVDLTEKYAMEKARAESANRSKSEFLANISHELRTPLNAVIGFSEMMQKNMFGPLGSQKYAEYAEDIHESGRYLLEVINDILDMSKIEAGRLTLDIKPIDAGAIIKDSMRIVSRSAEQRGVALSRIGPELVPLSADDRALKQILLNLLSNAVKFTPRGGDVTVGVEFTEQAVRIAIADTGIGIPEEDLHKLGLPFEQVENQFTKSHKGTGLGLAISRSLVELHGGHIEIASRVQEGTTVTVHLPKN